MTYDNNLEMEDLVDNNNNANNDENESTENTDSTPPATGVLARWNAYSKKARAGIVLGGAAVATVGIATTAFLAKIFSKNYYFPADLEMNESGDFDNMDPANPCPGQAYISATLDSSASSSSCTMEDGSPCPTIICNDSTILIELFNKFGKFSGSAFTYSSENVKTGSFRFSVDDHGVTLSNQKSFAGYETTVVINGGILGVSIVKSSVSPSTSLSPSNTPSPSPSTSEQPTACFIIIDITGNNGYAQLDSAQGKGASCFPGQSCAANLPNNGIQCIKITKTGDSEAYFTIDYNFYSFDASYKGHFQVRWTAGNGFEAVGIQPYDSDGFSVTVPDNYHAGIMQSILISYFNPSPSNSPSPSLLELNKFLREARLSPQQISSPQNNFKPRFSNLVSPQPSERFSAIIEQSGITLPAYNDEANLKQPLISREQYFGSLTAAFAAVLPMLGTTAIGLIDSVTSAVLSNAENDSSTTDQSNQGFSEKTKLLCGVGAMVTVAALTSVGLYTYKKMQKGDQNGAKEEVVPEYSF